MYNRYLPAPPVPDPIPKMQKHPVQTEPGVRKSFSLMTGPSGLDIDTVIALAVVWFLLSDGEIVHTDILIIVAVLFLLGL